MRGAQPPKLVQFRSRSQLFRLRMLLVVQLVQIRKASGALSPGIYSRLN
jgi:hypothetical protein